MSNSTDTNAIEQMREWREQYRSRLTPSPLENIDQLAAQLDLTHAHPSGIAQLFASGHASLDSLFRDAGLLRGAKRHVDRVLDDCVTKSIFTGLSKLSLVVGVASWKNNQMPILLYPVDIVQSKGVVGSKITIKFTGHVSLNASFISAMREKGVMISERELFDSSRYANGTPETSAVFANIAKQVKPVCSDFVINRNIILGCFTDPSSQFLYESQQILDALEKGASGNTMIDALAGDKQSIEILKNAPISNYSAFDKDPHKEYEVGDVDNSVRYVAQIAAGQNSLFVDVPAGENTAQMSAAIATRAVMNGKSVLYVPCVAEQKQRFMQIARAAEISDVVLDATDDNALQNVDKQLISAVGYQPGIASSRFEQLADELVGVRSRLTRYLGDLHGVNEQWGISAYSTIQNLANIAVLPTKPMTHVRLSKQTARSLNGHMQEWAQKLRRAAQLGEFTLSEKDTAWYAATIFNEDEAVAVYQRVNDALTKILPAIREQVATTVKTCGFPVPTTAQEWTRQVGVLKNLRRVLDVFQPDIFERDIMAMIYATMTSAERKEQGVKIGFWERRRLIKEAKQMLRVGAQVESLHDALVVVQRQAEQWRRFVPHGGWPVLPPKLDSIIDSQESLMSAITALNVVLASTPEGGNLENVNFNDLEARLRALYEDHMSLESLPERCQLEQDFNRVGLNDLVNDLRQRRVAEEAVEAELQLSWWTTVFDDIVRSSAIISNQDGSAMQDAADRFVQVDLEHIRSVGSMVTQEVMRKLCELLFARTQEANQLHTALAGSQTVSLSKVRQDYPEIMSAAKPIIVSTPASLVMLSNPQYIADIAIIDAATHMPSIELLSILCRVRQVVVIAHKNTITSPSLKKFASLLPAVSIKPHYTRRAPQVTQFLKDCNYGDNSVGVAVENAQGKVRMHSLDASGVPVIATGIVESSQKELDEVVSIITQRATTFSIIPANYILAVVTLTNTFRTRLGAELKALAQKSKSMERFLYHVRIIGIEEVAGIQATDVILSMGFAKTAHGRLIQQFGPLEGNYGVGMLLDALALADCNLDITSAFSSTEMIDERIHQTGPRFLKKVLQWAENLNNEVIRPAAHEQGENVLFNDLAERIRARGLNAALNYGFEDGLQIPLVVGLKDKPFALAILTDDAQFMSIQSTRERHRVYRQDLESLGWSVMNVWSVGAFVNPEKEVDRIMARIGEIYREI
ncbi:MAG: helicase [Bifidobacteriaceae bacterium]|nr:helicase [Bifidobacteriaceae bacterium]